MNRLTRYTIALAIFSLSFTSSVFAEQITACKNKTNGNLRVVSSAAECRNSETPLSWNVQGPAGEEGPAGEQGPAGADGQPGVQGPAGDGVKTFSGIVGPDGNIIVGNGFTVTRLEAGKYNINFPAGTWTAFPIMTVSPFGAFGAYGNPIVASVVGYGNGSAVFQVAISSTTPGETLYDNAFMFIAVQSN